MTPVATSVTARAELWNLNGLTLHSETFHEDVYAAEDAVHKQLAPAGVRGPRDERFHLD